MNIQVATKSAFDEIEKDIGARDVRFLRVEVPDLHGIARSKVVPAKRLRSLIERGLNFPLPPLALDVQCEAVEGTGYLEERGYPDITLVPDLQTFAVLPNSNGTARFIADAYHAATGEIVNGASRTVARKLFNDAAALGFEVLSGFEYEFYLLDPISLAPASDTVRQFATFDAGDRPLIYAIAEALDALGIEVTTANLEYGPSQFEVNFAPRRGLLAADQAFAFKNIAKEIAAASGRLASFITKPSIARSANGLHYNVSLWREGANAFADPAAPDHFSAIGRHFLAGQLHHASALSALLAPTINCSKRFRAHSFAPFEADWGTSNRTVALRVKAPGGPDIHIENRIGAGAANPYVAAAAILAAGLDGIRRALTPPPPRAAGDEETRFVSLPTALEPALKALEADAILVEALGQEFVKIFTTVKRHEIRKARRAIPGFDDPSFHERVDPWELSELARVL
ncbi:glutamine synthetase family protein [Hyphomicrobium sp. 2TAF46]|uniref:glutamine synthetase family protein n=1 Tax=Hyphomicrobium sp. 2TAF46 TaxID=3233019 RepID=UPI003F8E4C80